MMAQPSDADLAQRLETARLARSASPDRPEAHIAYGILLRTAGAFGDAHAVFEAAVRRWPGSAEARYQLAHLYASTGNPEAAIPHYEALVTIVPESAPALTMLAQALAMEGRSADALGVIERALALAPADATALATDGLVLTELGRFGDAIAAYRRAIAAAPQHAYAYHALAKLDPAALGGEDRRRLETIAHDADAQSDRWDAHFALAALADADGAYAEAGRHLTEANAVRRRNVRYDEAGTLAALARIPDIYTPAFFAAHAASALTGDLPVFIFGLPRSGTTLVEQILASHPSVFGTGELPRFAMHANALLGKDGAFSPATMRAADPARLLEIGHRYLLDLRRRAPAALRITDKMTMNYRFAGLIRCLFPEARMIHVRRDPRETALSCFMQNFAGDLGWPYDLREIGTYVRAYERVMEHWRTVLPPEAILEVRYEDVVDDVDGQARRLIAFCGLPWDDACVRFYENSRPVRTVSSRQVRRPIYRTSLGRAQHYRELLRPFEEAYAGA